MERRHYQRIRRRAIESATEDAPPKRQLNVPLVAGAVGALVLGLFIWFLISKVVPDSAGRAETGAGAEAVAGAGAAEGASVLELQQLVERFLAAESVEALLETVDHPDESEPRIREFYQDGDQYQLPLGGQIMSVRTTEEGEVKKHLYLVDRIFVVASLVSVVERADGQAKVEWEEAVGWMEKTWQEVVAERPAGPTVVKVLAVVDDYYNYDYRDEEKWQCIRLGDRRLESFCYAYMDRSNPAPAEVQQLNSFVPVTVEIQFAPDGQPGQAEISRFLHIGWADE